MRYRAGVRARAHVASGCLAAGYPASARWHVFLRENPFARHTTIPKPKSNRPSEKHMNM
jgi:hypothetical protein